MQGYRACFRQGLRAQIDCVTVKGSNRPLGLFTYDVTLERVAVPAPHDPVAATLAAAAAGLAVGTARNSRSSAAPRTPHLGASHCMEQEKHGRDESLQSHEPESCA